MGNICLYDEAFTKREMREETGRCDICKIAECDYSAINSTPVVRCKDCLAYESADGFCYVHADHMTEDDFCSKGTKRE